VIVVRDPGPGFDVAAVPNPLEGDNLLKGSGRGVFLIGETHMRKVGVALTACASGQHFRHRAGE
jgi:hypothetical protein